MAWWTNNKSAESGTVDASTAIGGQPLFSLFNKLAMTPRAGDGGFAVQIVGARAGAGTSSIARALAEFAALNIDGPVALVDADPFERAQFHAAGQTLGYSLQDVQRGTVTLTDACHPTDMTNLSLLALSDPMVRNNGHTAWTLSISAMSDIVDHLRRHFRWIVVDSAPAHELAFAHVLSRFMDGVVIVIESEKTRLPVAQQLIHQLRTNGGNPLGVVINKRQMLISDFLYRFL